jgi:hypothetical protein
MERYLVELDGDQIELLMGMVREAMKVADENKIPELEALLSALPRQPFWRGETGAAWEFHGSDGSAGALWLSIHLCRCGLAFTVCLG